MEYFQYYVEGEDEEKLINEKNLKKKLEQAEFDINKLWSLSPDGNFKNIKNDAEKIKKNITIK